MTRSIKPASCGALVALCAALCVSPAAARTFHVTRTGDPRPNGCKPRSCSLREAVLAANHHKGRDAIVLHAGRTYSLSRRGRNEDRGQFGDLDLVGPVAVRSMGDGHATVNAHRIDGVFDARRAKEPRFVGLLIRHGRLAGGGERGAGGITGGRVVIARSILTENSGPGAGAVWAGAVLMKRSIVRQNHAGPRASTGGVWVGSIARIEGSRVVRNEGECKGGISSDGSLSLEDSVVRRNRGRCVGGIDVLGFGRNFISIVDSGISRNQAEIGGIDGATKSFMIRNSRIANNDGVWRGGLNAAVQGSFVISDSSIVGNTGQETGGLFVGGVSCGSCGPSPRAIVRATIAGNRGGRDGAGGIFSLVNLHIRESTVSGNHSRKDGGGIHSPIDRVTVVNSTIAGNAADGDGGGIAAEHMTLRSSTIAHNKADADGRIGGSGGGVFIEGSGRSPSPVANSLLAFNRVGRTGFGRQCSGDFASHGHNIRTSRDHGCRWNSRRSDRVTRHVRLGHLSRNGGATQTIALKRGSAAIGHASRKTSPKRDQRSVKRDRHPDIGAFERR